MTSSIATMTAKAGTIVAKTFLLWPYIACNRSIRITAITIRNKLSTDTTIHAPSVMP